MQTPSGTYKKKILNMNFYNKTKKKKRKERKTKAKSMSELFLGKSLQRPA